VVRRARKWGCVTEHLALKSSAAGVASPHWLLSVGFSFALFMPPLNSPAVLVDATFPPVPASRGELVREYVAGGGFPWYGVSARTLTWEFDDVLTDFGDDIYERMLVDPQVAACVTVFKAQILTSGLDLAPAVTDKDDKDYELAARIVDEAERMLDDLVTPLDDVLWDMLNCLPMGNKVSEQVYEVDRGFKEDRPMLILRQLKVKPRHATAFVVDSYMNIVGLLAQLPGTPAPWQGTLIFTPDERGQIPNLISRDKFTIFTHRMKDNDPRGTSLIRPAFDPWWRKRQIIPEYLKYLAQFAGPSIVGFTPEGAVPVEMTRADGTTYTVTAQDVMLAALQQFRNGTAAAFPGGSAVKEIAMQGDGRAFLNALEQCDQQITKAVLTQELATEQSRNQARAAAQVHQDILGVLVNQEKKTSAKSVRQQILRPWVINNWGRKAAHLVPATSFGQIERQDMAALWASVAQLSNSNYLVEDQLPETDALVGLPVRQRAAFHIPPPKPGMSAPADAQPTDAPPNDVPDGRVVVRPHTRAARGTAQQQQEAQPAGAS
jgi:hypothetical protein